MRFRERCKNKIAAAAGFSLAELLAVLAIMTALMGVAFFYGQQMIRGNRQRQMDKIAEDLYLLAEAQLNEIYVFRGSGESSAWRTLTDNTAAATGYDGTTETLAVATKDDDYAKLILPEGTLSGELRAHDWSVIYNTTSLQPKAVVYIEDAAKAGVGIDEARNAIAASAGLRTNRLDRIGTYKGYVGYYEGTTQNAPALAADSMRVAVHMENGEELKAVVRALIPTECWRREKNPRFVNGDGKTLTLLLTVSGEASGAAVCEKITIPSSDAVWRNIADFPNENVYEATVTLDSFRSKGSRTLRFADTYGNGATDFIGDGEALNTTSTVGGPATAIEYDEDETAKAGGLKKFIPGENITVTAKLSVSTGEMASAEASAAANSLFASYAIDEGNHYEAHISYGRHLQNLTKECFADFSTNAGALGATAGKIRAVQYEDIRFDTEGEGDDEGRLWKDVYGTAAAGDDETETAGSVRAFVPIDNDDLLSYDGDYYGIYDLTIDESATRTEAEIGGTTTRTNVGLFADFRGADSGTGADSAALRNIRLVDAKITEKSGGGSAGGLAGRMDPAGNLTIRDCQLLRLQLDARSSGDVGGLSGAVSAAGQTVRVEKCELVSPRILGNRAGTGSTGGLIGSFAAGSGSSISESRLYMRTGEAVKTDAEPYVDIVVTDTQDAGAFADIENPGKIGEAGGLQTWLAGGKTAGGLVGTVSAPLTVEKSFAATVIRAPGTGSTAGGLVGSAASNGLTVRQSYADCYISADKIGGLAGACGSASTFAGCYSAGFVLAPSADTVAGKFVPKALSAEGSGVTNSYSLFAFTDITKAAATADEGRPDFSALSPSEVYKVTDDETHRFDNDLPVPDAENIGALTAPVTDAAVPDESRPYNLAKYLREIPLELYRDTITGATLIYPKAGLPHYGDWYREEDETPVEVGEGLVYYEIYLKKSSADGQPMPTETDAWNALSNPASVTGYEFAIGFEGPTEDSKRFDSLKYCRAAERPAYGTGAIDGNDWYIVGDGYGALFGTKLAGLDTQSGSNFLIYEHYIAGVKKYFYPMTSMSNKTDLDQAKYYKSIKMNYTPQGEARKTLQYYGDPHYAKAMVMGEDPGSSETPENIYVRTARQLYLMTKNYINLNPILKNSTNFLQEWDIDYEHYIKTFGNSTDFTNNTHTTGIGGTTTNNATFKSVYDGRDYIITGVNIVTTDPQFGLFRWVSEGGTIQNVRLVGMAQDDTKNNHYVRYTKTDSNIGGVLVGINQGTITNCAVSGYTVYGSGSYIIGGLVGRNRGTISNSSAVIPYLDICTDKSAGTTTHYVGGFVGENQNQGRIENCYAMALIGGDQYGASRVTKAGGFCGSNGGAISGSYCATAFKSSITQQNKQYGFCDGGTVSDDCYYLNGSGKFLGELYLSYGKSSNSTTSKGKPLAWQELLTAYGKLAEERSDSAWYRTDKEWYAGLYPFKTRVTRNAEGDPIHYGDWVTKSDITGEFGVFYWEHERGGSEGYHFTAIGYDIYDTTKGKDTIDERNFDTLCTTHDDGGVIDAYGYGYYYQNGLTVDLYADNNFYGRSKSGDATERYPFNASQVEQYAPPAAAFAEAYKVQAVAYATYVSGDDVNKKDNKRLKLKWDGDNESAAGKESSENKMNSTPYGVWELRVNGSGLTGERAYFTICPFFADAMRYWGKTAPLAISSGNSSNAKILGGIDHAFKVRSFEQLQFINWDSKDYSVKKEGETSSDKGYHPYLGYAKSTSNTTQYLADRYKYWKQTHDIDANGKTYVPIAGAKSTDTYEGFFGSYNGGKYKILDLSVNGKELGYKLAGMFGVIMAGRTSDGGKVYSSRLADIVLIGKKTTPTLIVDTSNDSANGVLVGAAHGYVDFPEIRNCVISGYTIRPQSDGASTEGWIGGLVGNSYATQIVNCEVNVKIQVNNNAKRVGGLAGAFYGTYMQNCYSAGSIENGGNNKAGALIGTAGWIQGTQAGQIYYGAPFLKKLYTDMGTTSGVKGTNQTTIRDCYSVMELKNGGNLLTEIPASHNPRATESRVDTTEENGNLAFINCYYYDNQYTTLPDTGWQTAIKPLSYGNMTETGTARDVKNLAAALGSDWVYVDAAHTYPTSTDGDYTDAAYPFPAVVTGYNGKVHYGDWPAYDATAVFYDDRAEDGTKQFYAENTYTTLITKLDDLIGTYRPAAGRTGRFSATGSGSSALTFSLKAVASPSDAETTLYYQCKDSSGNTIFLADADGNITYYSGTTIAITTPSGTIWFKDGTFYAEDPDAVG